MQKASICLFRKSSPPSKHVCQPYVPNEVFEAAAKVARTQETEVVRKTDAIYVVVYSETGPWKEGAILSTEDKWLPVCVYKIDQWSCGGITEKEYNLYSENK